MEFNQNKELLSNTLALNVALQTIKERCVHLQKRLYALESENSRLRLNSEKSTNNDKLNESRKDSSLIKELDELREKNAELTLQKGQLTENLTMISTENRKLWKRLSHLTKDNGNDSEMPKDPEGEDDQTAVGKHANLIRSKTFTQNSPHQLLREKIAGKNIGPEDDDLEDISLLNDCTFTASATDKFTSDINENYDIDTRSCAEGLLNIKKELLKQNSDLKVALSNWRKLKHSDLCSCKTSSNSSSNKRPQTVDKMIMTDSDLTLEFPIEQDTDNAVETIRQENILAKLMEKKKVADVSEKICPMCEKSYNKNILFEEFLFHVESHFTDDKAPSLDHNFELVPHGIGNF